MSQPERINQKVGASLTKARKDKGFTQESMAAAIANLLEKKEFSKRQYQKLEQGMFPKFKTDALKAADQVLGTNFVAEVYEQNVPQETPEKSAPISQKSWDNLTESVLVLSNSVDTGQRNISRILAMLESSSDGSLEIYSEDEVESFVYELGQELVGQTIGSPSQFAAHAKKVLAKIRFGEVKGKHPKEQSAKSRETAE